MFGTGGRRNVSTNGGVTTLELRAIESVLQLESGYVLDFTDAEFAAFFEEYGVDIGHPKFSVDGTSKAKRLRYFLRTTAPPLSGKVLAGLLQHRLAMAGDAPSAREQEPYAAAVRRCGGAGPAATSVDPEVDLVALVFKEEVFARLPVPPPDAAVLVARMKEAHACIGAEAYLAAVILCGSVLEGMCLGFGKGNIERVNRGYGAARNGKAAPRLTDWKLVDWIEVLRHLGIFSPNIERFGHALREFRNYVHPAEQVRSGFSPDLHTARIAFQVVVAAAEDLGRAGPGTATET
jgi:hypothetical protein